MIPNNKMGPCKVPYVLQTSLKTVWDRSGLDSEIIEYKKIFISDFVGSDFHSKQKYFILKIYAYRTHHSF